MCFKQKINKYVIVINLSLYRLKSLLNTQNDYHNKPRNTYCVFPINFLYHIRPQFDRGCGT